MKGTTFPGRKKKKKEEAVYTRIFAGK